MTPIIDCFSIVLIDLLLAGDNALVIAMAVRSLPARQRRLGIGLGAAIAVALRVVLTIMASQLLTVAYLKLAGGLLVLWIAVKVFADAEEAAGAAPRPRRFAQAIWYIVMADLTMSTDNILAVAGAAKGSMALIAFGLALSIPLVVFSSNLLSILMERVPATVYAGAAILGKVGGEMILTDPAVELRLHPTYAAAWAVEAALAIGVVAAGRLLAVGSNP